MPITLADLPVVPDYETDRMPFASHSEMMAQPGLEELMRGLLSPTQQRLRVVCGNSTNGEPTDHLIGDALAELNEHYGLVPRIGQVAKDGYLQLVDEMMGTPDGVPLAFELTKGAVVSMNAFAKQRQSYRPTNLPNLTWKNTPGLSMHGVAKGDSLVVTPTDTTERDYHRVQQSKAPDAKWQRSVGRTTQFLDVLFAQLFDQAGAAGIVNLGLALGDVARGTAKRAVDGSRTNSYFIPAPRERHPELAPPKPAKSNVITSAPEVDDSQAAQLLKELGLQPLGSKELKAHPLFTVLKSGGKITLGSVYEFGGFGDNAGFAAAVIDCLAAIPEGSELEAVAVLAEQLGEAQKLMGTRISSEAKHALSLFVDVVTQCSQHNFCQVAKNHTPQVHPTVRLAVQRLTLLRERMAPPQAS